jgi:hypothetical protein
MQKTKAALGGLAYLGFGALVANYAAKAITGKTGVEHWDQLTNSANRNLRDIQNYFGVKEESAKIFLKSMIYLDNYRVSSFHDPYIHSRDAIKDAKGDNETYKSLARRRPDLFSKFPRIGDMEAWEVYVALHTFFDKYDTALARYSDDSELRNLSFTEVAVREMSNDPKAPGGDFLDNVFFRHMAEAWDVTKDAASTVGSGVKKAIVSVSDKIGLTGVLSDAGDYFKSVYQNNEIAFKKTARGVWSVVEIAGIAVGSAAYGLAQLANLGRDGAMWLTKRQGEVLDAVTSLVNRILVEYKVVRDFDTFFSTFGAENLGVFKNQFLQAKTAGGRNHVKTQKCTNTP